MVAAEVTRRTVARAGQEIRLVTSAATKDPDGSFVCSAHIPGLNTELAIGAKHEKRPHPGAKFCDVVMAFAAKSQKSCRESVGFGG